MYYKGPTLCHSWKGVKVETVKITVAATDLIRRVFNYWEIINSTVVKIGFSKILIFTWKLQFYHWLQVLSIVFLEVTGPPHFEENACQIPKLNNTVSLLIIPSSKKGILWKGAFLNSDSSIHTNTSPLYIHCTSVWSRGVFCILISSHRIQKRYTSTVEI